MQKDPQILIKRKEFISNVMNSTELAIMQLEVFTCELKRAKNTTEKVKVVSDLLFLSEQTVFKDFAGK